LTIEQGLSLPKIISKCCELVKLCHINRSGPVFLRQTVYSTLKLNGCRRWWISAPAGRSGSDTSGTRPTYAALLVSCVQSNRTSQQFTADRGTV